MFENISLFQTAGAMAQHAAARQAVTTRNIANADTPGFRAQTLAAFADTYRADDGGAMRATRPGHMHAAAMIAAARPEFSDGEPSPNGNSVSLEQEMVAAVENQREHDRALAIYKHGLSVLRTALGR